MGGARVHVLEKHRSTRSAVSRAWSLLDAPELDQDTRVGWVVGSRESDAGGKGDRPAAGHSDLDALRVELRGERLGCDVETKDLIHARRSA